MKKIFSLMAAIASVLGVLSSPILSSTVKAQAQELPDLVDLLQNAGFNIITRDYHDTTIAQSVTATAPASKPVSLDAFPSLTSCDDSINPHGLMFTFTVESSQLALFKELQQTFRADLRLTQVADGVLFKTNKRWTTQDLELFKTHFASLSKSINVQTISGFSGIIPPLTKADKARIFFVNFEKSSPQEAKKLKELAQLKHSFKKAFRITINPAQTEMKAVSISLPMNLKSLDLSFYKDKVTFTFMVDSSQPSSFKKKFQNFCKSHGLTSVSHIVNVPNGFKITAKWMGTDLNNFINEFDLFSSNIYVAEIDVSLHPFVNVFKSAAKQGIGMWWLIAAAEEARFYSALPPG